MYVCMTVMLAEQHLGNAGESRDQASILLRQLDFTVLHCIARPFIAGWHSGRGGGGRGRRDVFRLARYLF